MYTLRKITKTGTQLNFALGDYYYLVQAQNPEFKKMAEELEVDPNEVSGFVSGQDPSKPAHCLYVGHQNYIMTDSGKTFQRI